jgi:hypothetical protein
MRPLWRRAARTARPARVRMRSRKPWVFALRRLFGWNVRLLTGAPDGLIVRKREPPRDISAGMRNAAVGIGLCTLAAYRSSVKPACCSPSGRVATPVLWDQHAAVRSPCGQTGRLPFIGHASRGRPRLWTTTERLLSAAETRLRSQDVALTGRSGSATCTTCGQTCGICRARARGASGE